MEDTDILNLAKWIKKQVKVKVRHALAVILLEYQMPEDLIYSITGIKKDGATKWANSYSAKGFDGLIEPARKKSLETEINIEVKVDGELTDQSTYVVSYNPKKLPQSQETEPSENLYPESTNQSRSVEDQAKESSVDNREAISSPTIMPDESQGLLPEVPDALANEDSPPDLDIALPAVEDKTGNWQLIDPHDKDDFVKNEETNYIEGGFGWKIIGASLRGRYHTYQGGYREDAFAIEVINGWNFIAVADGAGSAPLARVGSRIAVQSAIEGFKNAFINLEGNEEPPLPIALQSSLESAYNKLQEAAKARQVITNDLATTLLILAHKPGEELDQIGVAQVGDGMLVTWGPPDQAHLLAEPDQGQFAGETQFLTNLSFAELSSRVRVIEDLLDKPQYILVMTDGVGDDFYPPDTYLKKLVEHLPKVFSCIPNDAKKSLVNLISYPKRASFDDRTLVVLSQ